MGERERRKGHGQLQMQGGERNGKMKRLVLAVVVMAAGCAWGATPLALSFGGATIPDSAEVYGLHLSPFSFGKMPPRVTGLSLGGFDSVVADEMQGLQVAGLFSVGGLGGYVYGGQVAGWWAAGEHLRGIQAAGVFSGAEEMAGLQAAGLVSFAVDFRGVQIAGLLSQAPECHGLQMAFWTASQSMCGVQIGVMNFAVPAEDGWVVQIGLVNGIGRDKDAGWFEGTRYFPGINIGW